MPHCGVFPLTINLKPNMPVEFQGEDGTGPGQRRTAGPFKCAGIISIRERARAGDYCGAGRSLERAR